MIEGTRNGSGGWLAIVGAISAALAWRLLAFSGPLGSDDVTYFERALDVANGIWSTADYNGALRYGFNIPAGLMLKLFGAGEFQLNLWPLLCSLLEIGLVWWFCRRRFDGRVAAIAACLMALTPLHVATASRLHADAVANMFVTLSFVVFLESERRRSVPLAFAAGLAMGAVFWVKELLGVALLAFLLWPLAVRRLSLRWLWVVLGGGCMLVGHFLLMQAVAGDPLHAFKVVLSHIGRNFIATKVEDGAFYYVYYLLLDIRHTALLGPLGLIGLYLGLRPRGLGEASQAAAVKDTAFWLFALLIVLSLFPVSFSPFRLAMKQANYLGLFIAPLAVLAAVAICRVGHRLRLAALGLMVLLSVPLGILECQAYRVFIANGRGLVSYALANPDTFILGSANNFKIATLYAYSHDDPAFLRRFRMLRQGVPMPAAPAGLRTVVVRDPETIDQNPENDQLAQIPPCWRSLGAVTPEGMGLPGRVTEAAARLARGLPVVGARMGDKLDALAHPRPATLWAPPPDDPACRNAAGGATPR